MLEQVTGSVIGGTPCNIRFDFRAYAVSFICKFAAWRCAIKPIGRLCRWHLFSSKTIVTQEDSSPLQADLRNLVSWSSSGGLAFNASKCKVHRITRKLTPVTASCQLNEQVLGTSTAEKRPLTTSHGTGRFCAVFSKSNRMLRFVRRSTRFIDWERVCDAIHI